MKPLIGQGKPFHSAVDKTAALLKRKVGTGAEFMKELMGVTGIKPTELQERGPGEQRRDQGPAAGRAGRAPGGAGQGKQPGGEDPGGAG